MSNFAELGTAGEIYFIKSAHFIILELKTEEDNK